MRKPSSVILIKLVMALAGCGCPSFAWTPSSYAGFPLSVEQGTTVTVSVPQAAWTTGTTDPPGCDCGPTYDVEMDNLAALPPWVSYDKTTKILTLSPTGAEPTGDTLLRIQHRITSNALNKYAE